MYVLILDYDLNFPEIALLDSIAVEQVICESIFIRHRISDTVFNTGPQFTREDLQ